MDDVEFVKLLKQINDAVIKKESIINGWRSTGLQPFDFNNLKTEGFISKSPDRIYDFKGFYIDSLEMNITENASVSQPKVNVISNVVLDPSSELYMHHTNRLTNKSDAVLADVSRGHYNNNDNVLDQQTHMDVEDYISQEISVSSESSGQRSSTSFPELELIGINMDDIPEGPIPLHVNNCISIEPISPSANFARQESPLHSRLACTSQSFDQEESSSNDQVRVNNGVKLSELAGHNEIFRSTFDTNFSLGSFGLFTETTHAETTSKIGNLAEKMRRDVKQLGLLCASSAKDKEKLINVSVINQQLNIIDPPLIEQSESVEEPRTIKSILQPPTMPQRVKSKRNLNLKISYGVVTAKEVVQSLFEREAADRRHEIQREEDEIAKLERDNEIKEVDEQLRDVRKLSSNARSENVALNKELAQKKKNKSIDRNDLALQEAAKDERENIIKQHDDQLRELRDKLKDLKSIHVATNKAVLLKRKTFEQEKKAKGKQVQPSITPPEIDESQLDSEPY